MDTTRLGKNAAPIIAALLLAACGSAVGQDSGTPFNMAPVDVSRGSSLVPVTAIATVGVYYPNGGAVAHTVNRLNIQVQGSGSLVTSSCESLNGPLTATYDALLTTDEVGVVIVNLAPAYATWQSTGCTISAGAPGLVSGKFTAVGLVTVATAVAAGAQSCASYCAGGPRAPSCAEQCETYATIHTSQQLSADQVASYQGTGAFAGALYLNMLR